MSEDEERVRRRAYEIWEREGRPEGRHEEHWRRAVTEIASGKDGKTSAATPVPGPGSGLRTPPSAIERGLHEAADALRGTDAGANSETQPRRTQNR